LFVCLFVAWFSVVFGLCNSVDVYLFVSNYLMLLGACFSVLVMSFIYFVCVLWVFAWVFALWFDFARFVVCGILLVFGVSGLTVV